MTTDPSRWHEVRALFEEVAELAEPARRAALDRDGVDPLVRTAVERLLAADREAESSSALRAPRSGSPTPPPGATPPAAPPRRLGHYELHERLGSGGMGEVYAALDTHLARRVAIKLLAPRLTGDPQWLRRFVREARAASTLNHPNIVTIHDIGESDGTHWIATELVDGSTLREQLRRGPLPVRRAVDIACQIAGALAASHAAGIVHRDIKPENVMVRADGLVKVLDFGVADTSANAELASDSRGAMTRPGAPIGTLGYMSPEQLRGAPVDGRSDVFALGVLLYEALAGRPPFSGSTPVDTMVAVLEREPAPLRGGAEVPPELERIVLDALRKTPAERPPSAAAMLDALRAIALRLDAPRGAVRDAAPATAVPPVHYARSGDFDIAYQVVGDAPLDLVFVMGWVSHLEYVWSEPSFARFLRRLSSFARVILFDKRGTGLSDRVPTDQLPTLEQRMDDVRAVMEAVGSERAVLCGVSEGGPMCTLFAATHPEKTIALVMIGSYARRLRGDGYPWGPTQSEREAFFDEIRSSWGGPVGLAERAPSKVDDERFREWWAAYLRHGASPNAALALTRMNTEIDIRHVLPTVQVPTLVLHRSGDVCLRVEEGRYLAERIPGARFLELPGVDHLPFVGDQTAMLAQIEEFLTGMPPAPEFDRVLATVLVALPPAATSGDAGDHAVLARCREPFAREVALARGRAIGGDPGRLLATFDGPARAIRAACAVGDAARRLGIRLHTGLHTGECDAVGDRVSGAAVEIAAHVAARASAGEVLVSSTVRDLVAGAGIRFADPQTRVQAGDLGEFFVFAVARGAAT